MPADTANQRRSRAELLITIFLLYVACITTLGPTSRLSQWHMPEDNQAAMEALAWLDGRLDVPGRGIDVAQYAGHYYNIFPILWTCVCYAVYGLNRLLYGETLVFWTPLYLMILAVPIPLLAFGAFRRSGVSRPWAAVLAFYAVAGTALWPEMAFCRDGWIYSIQHVLSQTGLALILWDLLGARRFWVGGLGVLIAAWSRQTCLACALPLLWMAWRSPHRRTALLQAGIPLAVTLAVPMALNQAKFGSPLEIGYRYILDDPRNAVGEGIAGPDGSKQLFSWRYLPDHFYHMWLAPPVRFELTHANLVIEGDPAGTAVWIATPLILLIFVEFRKVWTDPVRRALVLATLLVMLVDLCYHGPTLSRIGHNRYVLDFMLVWLVAIAPWTHGPRRRWFTLACLGWSVFFFYMVTPS
jgi:hypothetical protein